MYKMDPDLKFGLKLTIITIIVILAAIIVTEILR